MKKYFTIAAVLGVIAFASVSFLAQADQQPGAASKNVMVREKAANPAPATDPSDGEAAADEAAAAPVDAKFDQDDQDCAASAAAPSTKNGADPTDTQKDMAYKKCMLGRGHTYAELKANEGGDRGEDDSKGDGKGDDRDHGENAEE